MRRPLCIGLLIFLTCYLTVFWGLSQSQREGSLAKEENARASSADSGWEARAGEWVLLKGKAAELYEPVDGSQENMSFTLTQVCIYSDSGEELTEIAPGTNSFIPGISQQKNSVICYPDRGEPLPEVGSRVWVRGILTPFREATNPGEFDAAGYYENRGYLFSVRKAAVKWQGETYDRLGNRLYELRSLSAGLFVSLLGERDGAVAAAMVLGLKKDVDAEVKALYQDAGIAHLLAISGLHVTMLGMAFWKMLKGLRLPQWPAALLTGLFLFAYGMATGMSVSTQRAMILFFLTLAARLLGRTADPLTGLALAACVILVPNPRYLLDAGFQLSFTAVAGAVMAVPVLQEKGVKRQEGKDSLWKKKLDGIYKAVTSSMGITLATLPVLLFHYYKWNPWSVLANVVVIPLMGILLPWLLFLAAAGMALGELPGMLFVLKLLALPAGGILSLYRTVCRVVLWLPGSSLHTGRPQWWQMLLYGLGLVLLVLWGRRISPRVRLPLAALLTAVFLIRFPGQLVITMLDVGQGECICVETQEHHFYLIDAGSSSNRSAGKYQIIPFLEYSGARRLEGIFITHWDEDHVNALEDILEWAKRDHVEIGRLFLPGAELADEGQQKLLALAAQYGIMAERIVAGQSLEDGKIAIDCLHPYADERVQSRNASSCVLKLSSKEFSAVFTGDLEEEGEKWLVSSYRGGQLEADVLDAGHHGSANASTVEFLRAVSPKTVLISCGKNNSYGHPARETLKRIENQRAACFVTSKDGAVTVCVKKEGFSVKAFGKEIK